MYITVYTFIPVIVVLILTLFAKYYKRRLRINNLAKQLPGPPSLPLIGNGLEFLCKNEEILQRLSNLIEKYPHPMKIWTGTYLTICFRDPNSVERILLSPKLAQKHRIYDFVKNYLGEGLITASGPVYKKHRKLIQPMFNIPFFTAHYDVFGKHSNILLKQLDKHVDQEAFDILPLIHNCVIDIVGEAILGTDIASQEGCNLDFVETANKVYDLGFTRLTRPWLYPDIIYNFTSYKKLEDKYMSKLTSFMEQLCQNSIERIKSRSTNESDEHMPIIDQISQFRRDNPQFVNDIDFVFHMLTLYFASEDTISTICAFACLCLGMYPEYQEKLAQEIFDIFGNKPRPVTLEDIKKLSYMDKCIKDVLRLFPIAPYILRTATDDCQIGEWLIPEGVSIIIPIFNIHRDPVHWENPQHFHPDHFEESKVISRHNYAYLPFSAGARNCIGKTFTNIGLKVILSTLLQNFEFVATGKVPDLKLRMDISTRSMNGHVVRLKRRVWT